MSDRLNDGKSAQEGARLVREAGPRPLGAGDCAAAIAGIAVLAVVSGLALGAFAWAMLHLWMLLVRLIWADGALALGWWFYPIVVGVVGGVLIGLWSKAFRSRPEPLNAVIAGIKSGGYRVRSLAAGSVAFLMPLAFGGSVGPAAGLVGLIATGCSRTSEMLVRAGVRAARVVDGGRGKMLVAALTSPFSSAEGGRERACETTHSRGRDSACESERSCEGAHVRESERACGQKRSRECGRVYEAGYSYSRAAKVLLYSMCAVSAALAVAMLARFVGWELIVPRFAFSLPSWESLFSVMPLALCGYVLALLTRVGGGAGGAASRKFAKGSVLPPVACGLALGCVAAFLPNVMFTGQAQTVDIMASWAATPAVLLLVTGIAKALATPFCISMGWCGGPFYPLIFAGVSFGYGAASIFGLDPVLCASVVATSLLVAATRKPVLVLVLLMICFPLRDLLWMIPAALIALAIPVPKALKAAQAVEVS